MPAGDSEDYQNKCQRVVEEDRLDGTELAFSSLLRCRFKVS